MKTNKFIISMIILVLLAASFNLTAFAEEAIGSHNTGVDISFIAGSTITPPVNPDKPDEESGLPGTNQPGPLSMDWVPTLNFGASHLVTSTVQSYNNTTARPYIQITDLRGSGSGWKVTAALSSFTSGGNDSLLGAYITLSNGRTNTVTSGIEPPVPADPITLTSDNATTNVAVASSALQAGRGTWVIRWYPVSGASDIRLTVPAAAATIGTHTATITWMLYDTP